MDDRRFDHLTRTLAALAPRRAAIAALAGSTFAALLAGSGREETAEEE